MRFRTTPPPLRTFASIWAVYVLPFTGLKPASRMLAVARALNGADGWAVAISFLVEDADVEPDPLTRLRPRRVGAQRNGDRGRVDAAADVDDRVPSVEERAAVVKRASDGFAAPDRVRRPLCQRLVWWSRKTNQMNMSVRLSFFAMARARAV